MRVRRDHHNDQKHPELSPDLCLLDEALGTVASRERVPVGLTQRLYEASVSSLPPRLRLRERAVSVPHQSLRFHRARWGQLAMAASVALAFCLAAWFLAGPPSGLDVGSGSIAADVRAQPVVRGVAYESAIPLTLEAEWFLFESGFNGDGATYLVDTRDLTLAQLRGESSRVFDEFEL